MINEITPYDALRRVYHEPSRLAIVTALCGTEDGLSFCELKAGCDLTDGNLNRHLKALTDAGAVKLLKTRDGHRSKTVVELTDQGRSGLVDYLQTLETVLHQAAAALQAETKIELQPVMWERLATTSL
jgi:DNA-binding transcriptional ArsR family regulator